MNAHTLSRTLADSIRPALKPTVAEMAEKLTSARKMRAFWQAQSIAAAMGSAEETAASDEAAACDDREAILVCAILAAADAALEPLGLTFRELEALQL